ncbi:sigma factor G inhibitor Gin [Paenactinomyces guangxiensis]|uniref:Sigma factor G inhibitor Gin n=1 Tax=Paenactinomyces guangxiensis TaxID=1490290 RepID=A0A7W2A9L3_9BACL|nr:sigma factor G inhibitor Gin [Paenactinomyces guangxiensis]MBH8592935.1 sigma factor G inhibitor Gin [Paenactinomyces guangxiensis]
MEKKKRRSIPLQEKSLPIFCIICGHPYTEGLELLGNCICTSCENDIVKSEAEDIKYLHYVYRLRTILSGLTSQ